MTSLSGPSSGDRLRLLGVFAHPDDETFCAGGTFARYSAEGAEVMVVSVTRGDAGQIRDARVATRRTLGQVRERELRLACERLGIQHAVCLEYRDGTLKDVDQEVLARDVARIIRSFRPDVVITFGDDGAYGHPDHIAVSAATTAAFLRAGYATLSPEEVAAGLAPHKPARLYHSHFPRSRMLLMDRLVPWLVEHDRRFRGTFDFVRALLLFAEETSVLHYCSDHVDVNWYPHGFYIVEQGEPATDLYLILSGQAEVIREDDNGTQHSLASLGPGEFFGEEGLAYRRPRNAHVVAVDSVTCLVISPAQPTAFAGRGEGANPELGLVAHREEQALTGRATTCIDASDYADRKIAAMAEHRTQYPLKPDMLPLSMIRDLMGREYFVRIYPPPEMETALIARSHA